jgi:hypothetical protein
MDLERKEIPEGVTVHTQSVMLELNALPKEEYKRCFNKLQNHWKHCVQLKRG